MGYSDLEKTDNGYLVNIEEWNEAVAKEIAEAEGIPELTQRHWDLINYLREEFLDNGGNQPNDRHIVKAMSDKWGESVGTKDLYTLFPKQPSKQAAKIGGLPESKRKGGY
jgi:tRNA 2-thiouridine synthesizing protein E